jgi:outer membrane protein OmpA-like peptidoglycan-associated protein
MKQKRATSRRLLAASLLLACSPLTVLLHADTNDNDTLALSLNQYGTRGLSQTGSAEALGQGRTTFGLILSGYPQLSTSPGEPRKGAAIFTGLGALSYGVNNYLDVFASSSEYGILGYTDNHASGLGALSAGVQGALPLFLSSPFRFAAQAMYIQGLASAYIDRAYDHRGDRLDGYSFFQVQPFFPTLTGKLLQTLILLGNTGVFKIHANEGVADFWEGERDLLLLAIGAQYDVNQYTFGLEANSRTSVKDHIFDSDPLWVTPSLQYRPTNNINLNAGADISLSQARIGAQPRALEDFCLFGGIAFSFNASTFSSSAPQASVPVPEVLTQKDCHSCDSLSQIQHDNLVAEMHEKSTADSLALLNAQKMLEEERARRTDPEKQLLATGLYELDTLYFETGLMGVSMNSQLYLNMIAKMLLKYPKLQIEVAGHTDNEGGAVGNMRLSQRRAESVMNYLLMAAPDLNGRLTAKGYGLTEPVADNTTARGRMHNRRVELRVLNKEVLQEYNP